MKNKYKVKLRVQFQINIVQLTQNVWLTTQEMEK